MSPAAAADSPAGARSPTPAARTLHFSVAVPREPSALPGAE